MTPAPLVWINAFPGTGKLTIARHLLSLHKNTILIDNHKLIDPVEAKFSRDHPQYYPERKRVRQLAFEEYATNPDNLSQLLIFTDVQSTNELGTSVANEYKLIAEIAQRPFNPVYLTCDVEENVKRVNSLARQTSGTTKLLDCDLLRKFHGECELYRFEGMDGLTIDVTNIAPKKAAEMILEYVLSEDLSEEVSILQGS